MVVNACVVCSGVKDKRVVLGLSNKQQSDDFKHLFLQDHSEGNTESDSSNEQQKKKKKEKKNQMEPSKDVGLSFGT